MTRLLLLSSMALLLAASQLPLGGAQKPPRLSPGSVALCEEFAVGKSGRVLTVPVVWNGRVVEFMLDSGAAKTVIDSSLRSELGKPIGEVDLITSAGTVTLETFICPIAQLGSLEVQRIETVVSGDLEPLRFAVGKNIYGILGMDFLGRYAVEIDFDEGKLRFWQSAPDDWRCADQRFPLLTRDGRPHVSACIGGRRTLFILDTGANRSHVSNDVFHALADEDALRLAGSALGMTLGGGIQASIGYANRFAIGEFSHQGIRFDSDAMSGLGLNYLSRYRLRCDFPNNVLYLCEGARFNRPESTATSGMAIAEIHGLKTVVAVEPGNAADTAGIRRGDVIKTIDGKSTNDFEMYDLRKLFTSRVGEQFHLEVEREQCVGKVLLTLRSRLPNTDAVVGR